MMDPWGMNTKLVYVIVSVVMTMVMRISLASVQTTSAVDDDSCANQMERQDRFEDKFEDDGNPNNDKGNEESWTNSFKNREPC
jgi:hypothetical protein